MSGAALSPAPSRPGFFPEIEGLRGLLALLVILHHAFGSVLPEAQHPFMWAWGSMDMFFCISGFLIGRNFFTRYGAQLTSAYFINRALRIWPMYYLALGLYGVVALGFDEFLVFGKAEHFSTGSGAGLWTPLIFMQNAERHLGLQFSYLDIFKHSWSVALEEQFYLIVPFVLLIFRNRSTAFVIIVLGCMLTVTTFARANGVNHAALLGRCDGFVLGLVLAICHVRSSPESRWLHSKGLYRVALVTSVILLAPYVARYYGGPDLFGGPWRVLAFTLFNPYFGFSLLAFALIGLIVTGSLNRSVERLLRNPFLQRMGEISYSTYLLHNAVVFVLVPALLAATGVSLLWGIPLSVVLTLLVAQVTYRYVERPFMSMKVKPSGQKLELTSPSLSNPGAAAAGKAL